MHENAPTLTATPRQRLGTRYAKRARQSGRLPAIVYGHKQTPVPVVLDAREALLHIHKGEKVFQLDIEGEQVAQTVLLKDVQFDYLGTNIVHCDFTRVDLDERIHTRVHVKLIGDAKGLGAAGAILMHPTTEIEIECPVTELPDEIEVDISELGVGEMVTAGDVALPSESMRLLTDEHAVLAHIVVQHEEEEVGESEEVTGESEEPEVITAKKEEEEGEGESEKKD